MSEQKAIYGHAGLADWRPTDGALVHFALAAALFGFLALIYGNIYSIHHDLAGSLQSGKLAMALGTAFNTYSVYFPPIEQMWFSLAVQIQEKTGLRLDLAAIFMTGAAILFSTELAYYIRKKTTGATPLFLIVSIFILTAFPIAFKNVFGLREHMVALGLWPYIVLRMSDPQLRRVGLSVRLLIGLWMGFTLLFKYLFAVIVLLVELAEAIVQRRPGSVFRVENLISGTIVFFYLLFWLGLQSENREAISVMANAISANLNDPWQSVVRAFPYLCITLLLMVLSQTNKESPRKIIIPACIMVGAIFTAWVQLRWYTHHVFAVYTAVIAWLWISNRKFPRLMVMLICAIVSYPTIMEFLNTSSYQRHTDRVEQAFQQANVNADGKKIALLTLHPSPFNQVFAQQGATRWTPFMNLAFFPAELEKYDRPESAGQRAAPIQFSNADRALLHSKMLQLWEDYPPDAFLLDNSSSWPLRHLKFEWQRVLSGDVRFQAIIADYEQAFSYNEDGLNFSYYTKKQ